ncbi:LOW QUALITY PROTEIN: centrosomal protein of 126 kDa [Octodon degus]|uniref:LOW QUALITY PROTEIN: centrosomal protein of 126 kDa n=1 Tax=Octodon degus TaxID=10160 RepID=A0A6P6DYV5_OCTDE|nr:LOW QUALITY PROTEIN: centrosomal protein of 126 kDa [Octodon degus]
MVSAASDTPNLTAQTPSDSIRNPTPNYPSKINISESHSGIFPWLGIFRLTLFAPSQHSLETALVKKKAEPRQTRTGPAGRRLGAPRWPPERRGGSAARAAGSGGGAAGASYWLSAVRPAPPPPGFPSRRTRPAPSPREGGARPRPGAYLDMKIHLEKNLEEERQILLQQQKICRNRARKYFVESNRRKKAFEEKRKEHEEREHQIREQILQQRKQKFEEVTEKFQRAHIPLSQRRRAVFHRSVPPLEEALKQIQESNLKSENLPFSHRPTINWRTIDCTSPSALSKNDPRHRKHLLSKTNWDIEMKENNMVNLATNKNVFQFKLEETQKLLEDQHLSSFQRFCDEVKQITNSETLSSIDSLEVGEHEELYFALKEEPSAVQQNAVSLNSANLQSADLNHLDEDELSFSKTQHINNWLSNLDAQNAQSVPPCADVLSKPSILSSWGHFNSQEQNQSTLSKTVERATSTANNSVAFVYSPPVVVLSKKTEKNSEISTLKTNDFTSRALKSGELLVTETPAFAFNKAWVTPDSQTQEVVTFQDQEKHCQLTQQNRTTVVPSSFVPMAPLPVSPSSRQSARPLVKNAVHIKEVDAVQCSDELEKLKDVIDEKMKYFNCEKKELPLFSDSFQAAHIPQHSDSKDRKPKIAETSTSLHNVISNYDLLDQHKKMKCNIHERNGVKFLKSILKKESKYEHDYFKTLFIKQGFKFRNQKAAAIRDSIELTKEKEKGIEILKTTKKLRWFDETVEKESSAEDSHSLKAEGRPGAPQQWSQQFCMKSPAGSIRTNDPGCAVTSAERKKSEEVSKNVSTSGGSGRDHVPLNCFIPSDYNFTKQAWSVSKEENISPVDNSDSKTQKSNPQRGGAKVIRRAGSAKVLSGVIDANRKDPVTQPQSTSKANAFTQAQGRLIIPHPPPKPVSNSKNTQMSPCRSVTPQNSQSMVTHDCFNSRYMLPTEHNFNQWNRERSPPLSHACSDLVTVIPALPSYYSSECQTLAKADHANSTQVVAQQDGTLYCTQRTPVSEESYQAVTLNTTKQESIPSWKRGNNGLQQTERATDSTLRRKRIVENKQRSLSDQKRKNPGSVAQKFSGQMHNFGQTVQLSSREPKQTTRGAADVEEVSDSTSEFLMAENLVNVSMPEDEILTVLNNKQLQKSDLAFRQTQRLDLCALSAEEQRVLQSLDQLDKRLFYIQETICKNPSIKNMIQIIPLLVSSKRVEGITSQ